MEDRLTTPVARRIAFAGATTLTVISATCCALFGWQIGLHHSVVLAALMGGAALAAEALKPIAVVAAIDAGRRWHLLSAGLFALLAAVLITYSVAAELSLSSTVRGDLAAQRAAATESHKRAQQRYVTSDTKAGCSFGTLHWSVHERGRPCRGPLRRLRVDDHRG